MVENGHLKGGRKKRYLESMRYRPGKQLANADLKEVSYAPQIFGETESPYFIFIFRSVETQT